MKQKLVFLGTAGDSLTLARQQRRGGGFAIVMDGGQYLVDPGPGVLASASASGIHSRETICVLSTNNSLLASDGVNQVIDAMTLGGADRFGVLVAAQSIPEGTEAERTVLRSSSQSWVERVVTFSETTRIGVNHLNIFPRSARHLDPTALGFRFEGPGFVVSYTGDTDYFAGLGKEHADADILVIRCKHPKGTREQGSLNVEEVIKLVEEAKPRLAILTGFGNKLLEGDIIATARTIHRETKVQVIAAKDGQEVDISQYVRK